MHTQTHVHWLGLLVELLPGEGAGACRSLLILLGKVRYLRLPCPRRDLVAIGGSRTDSRTRPAFNTLRTPTSLESYLLLVVLVLLKPWCLAVVHW